MRLFCREDHSAQEYERDLPGELLEARGRLAKLKKLPLSAFASKTHKQTTFGAHGPIYYTVDNRADTIAKAEADIAELEVLASEDLLTPEAKASS